MKISRHFCVIVTLFLVLGSAGSAEKQKPPSTAEVLEAARASDWRPLDPAETLVLELESGRVLMELAPDFAPNHVANIKTLVKQRYFDGLAIIRSQDNYVVQWGDPSEEPEKRRSFGQAKEALPAEFDRSIPGELDFTPSSDGDVYAPEVGFSGGWPVALDRKKGRMWLAHCYGMLGAGRAVATDSGSGAELYVIIGHAPRHLDRNVTLVGRVIQGMEHLSVLPRGTGPLGFYENPEQHVPIRSIRLASEQSPGQRERLELLRTDTATFEALIASRRYRYEEWFAEPGGKVELCNVPLPVRVAPVEDPVEEGAAGSE